jgi:hypothetical protein
MRVWIYIIKYSSYHETMNHIYEYVMNHTLNEYINELLSTIYKCSPNCIIFVFSNIYYFYLIYYYILFI